MDRYFIEPYTQRKHKNRQTQNVRYMLFDRRGSGPLAKTMDAETAQRICALLNADGLKPEKGTAK